MTPIDAPSLKDTEQETETDWNQKVMAPVKLAFSEFSEVNDAQTPEELKEVLVALAPKILNGTVDDSPREQRVNKYYQAGIELYRLRNAIERRQAPLGYFL